MAHTRPQFRRLDLAKKCNSLSDKTLNLDLKLLRCMAQSNVIRFVMQVFQRSKEVKSPFFLDSNLNSVFMALTFESVNEILKCYHSN